MIIIKLLIQIEYLPSIKEILENRNKIIKNLIGIKTLMTINRTSKDVKLRNLKEKLNIIKYSFNQPTDYIKFPHYIFQVQRI